MWVQLLDFSQGKVLLLGTKDALEGHAVSKLLNEVKGHVVQPVG